MFTVVGAMTIFDEPERTVGLLMIPSIVVCRRHQQESKYVFQNILETLHFSSFRDRTLRSETKVAVTLTLTILKAN